MIANIVTIRSLHDSSACRDVAYWLSRPAEERISAVEYLRRQHHGNSIRLQRIARVIKRATGRKKDLADLEALGEE